MKLLCSIYISLALVKIPHISLYLSWQNTVHFAGDYDLW